MSNSIEISGIDLNDPESFCFEDSPSDFVLLDATPIVFTVRGVRHFSPRFALFGVDLANLKTETQFKEAEAAWMVIESHMMMQYLQKMSKASFQATAAQELVAFINGDTATSNRLVKKLEHKELTNLKSV